MCCVKYFTPKLQNSLRMMKCAVPYNLKSARLPRFLIARFGFRLVWLGSVIEKRSNVTLLPRCSLEGYIVFEMGCLESARTAKASTARRWSNRTTIRSARANSVVIHARFALLGTCLESIGNCGKHIAANIVAPALHFVLTRVAEADALALSEYIVCLNAHGGIFALQELIFKRGIPYPLLGVVA